LALARREPQTQAVVSRPAAVDVAQVPRYDQVGSGKQGTADAGSDIPAGRGRCLRSKPDAVKMALASRES
jgi:hypothetical protein